MSGELTPDELKELLSLMEQWFDNKRKAMEWFFIDNLMLGGITPILMINNGRGQKLLKWVRQSIEENKPQ